MRLFTSLDSIPSDAFPRGSAVAVGKLDGVHRGHRALLERIVDVSATRGLEPVVFTFQNNPISYLRPDRCPPAIMSVRQRQEVIASLGVSACVMVPFDAHLANIPAEEFIEEILVAQLQTRFLCMGGDFRFGYRGAGSVALLTQMGERLGFDVEVIAKVEDPRFGRVSSSRVREAIAAGDVASAARMIERPVTLRGHVVRGDARGRELGFPTANLGAEIEGLVPRDGVYAGWAVVDGQQHPAAISVGVNITFEPDGAPRVEAHLLDFHEDLYGRQIEVQFAERLRDMVAFDSAEALVAQLHRDVDATRVALRAFES